MGDNVNEIDDLKLQLVIQFQKKNIGTLFHFLRIEVAYSPKGYSLSQSNYINNRLDKLDFIYTKEENIPLKMNVKYVPLMTLIDHIPLCIQFWLRVRYILQFPYQIGSLPRVFVYF